MRQPKKNQRRVINLLRTRLVEGYGEKSSIINQTLHSLIFFSPGCRELVLGDTRRLVGRQADGSTEAEPGSDVPGLELPAQPSPHQLPQVSMGRRDGENGPITGTVTLPIR